MRPSARTVVLSEVLDMQQSGLAQAEDAVRNFATLAGPVINGYAFCDLTKQEGRASTRRRLGRSTSL
jgi:hypothetical protein